MRKATPAYLAKAPADCEKLEDGMVTERIIAPALWEMMYFGTDRNV